MRSLLLLLTVIPLLTARLGGCVAAPSLAPDVPAEVLGKLIFFDTQLSDPPGQACASCHSPASAFTDPRDDLPVSRGILDGHVGNRNTPTVAYAAFSPPTHYAEVGDGGSFVGGQFWDGRARTLEAQAGAPFLNPLEMHAPDAAYVVEQIRSGAYADLFRTRHGPDAFDDVGAAYEFVAADIAAYERSPEVSPFSSRFDAYRRGEATLTASELRGLAIFEDPQRGNCTACHPSGVADDGTPPLFTDFTYDNLGIPRNDANPFLYLPPELNPAGSSYVDLGIGGVFDSPADRGKFKVPTLRNVALTAPYGHNGYFRTLRDVVVFYARRDSTPALAVPEVAENVNRTELGDLPLDDADIDDVVAFLATLSDGYHRAP